MSHIFVLVVLGLGVTNIRIKRYANCDFGMTLENKRYISTSKLRLVSYSPYLVIVLFAILAYFSTTFLVLFVYTLTNLRKGRALPSERDIKIFEDRVLEEKIEWETNLVNA
ncbi:hypothetical protein M0Q97_05145 [Candidatus Dojkabacteria bacterium]|nr:hypothetical protein [Candidatus Dojkabacteria bacterium]